MKISVIIPAIESKKAEEVLKNILSQEGVSADEIIIAGRGLSSLERSYADKVNIKIKNEKTWINAAAARNLGAKSASGDIFLFVDDDCLPAKNWIAANLKALEDKDVGAVSGRLLGLSGCYFARVLDLSGFWMQQNNIKKDAQTLYSATLGIRKDIFNEVGGFDESMDIAEDVDLARRLIQRGFRCLYAPDIVVYHDHKRDTFYKTVSFMHSRGQEYMRSLKPKKRQLGLFFKIWTVIICAARETFESYKINSKAYKHVFIYLPGMFIEFLAWYAGICALPVGLPVPETLIFFVTSRCNLACKHCFYWQQLNSGNDLAFQEIKKFSASVGEIKDLLISGGEPFLREDLVEICLLFRKNNRIRHLSIPTNASLPQVVLPKVEQLMRQLDIDVTINLSIDGTKDYHDALRGIPGVFDNVMETYRGLAVLKKKYPHLKITVNPTITSHNTEEVIKLARFVKEQMAGVDYFWPSILRGDPKSSDQVIPDIRTMYDMYKLINEIFYKDRKDIEGQRKAWDVLFKIKMETLKRGSQVLPCRAGREIGVLDSDGSVRVCELREPLGNIRQRDFLDIWNSYPAYLMRKSIKNKECYCTHECFIYPSFVKAESHLLKRIFTNNC